MELRSALEPQADIPGQPRRPIRRHERALWREGSWTLGLNAGMLGVNLVTGVLVARLLGTVGRGQLTAIVSPPLLLGWALAMSCLQATSYHEARHPEDAGRLIGTWLIIMAPLSLLALIVGELLLPVILAAQTPVTLHLAQIFMLTVVTVLLGELFYGVLLGDHDFLFYNLMRFGQPAATALAYVVLWQSRRFTVESALIATAAPALIGLAIATRRAIRRYGLSRPSLPLARTTLWYGVRAHGTAVGSILNTRLDMLIIPAFLGASSVGLYDVAGTVAGLVITLAGTLSLLVLPMAARERAHETEVVIQLTRVTFIVAVVCALGLAVVTNVAVPLVYGHRFDASIPLVLILLPGTVLYATAGILTPALFAANRPLTASATGLAGLAITVPGLIIFLRSGGIVAAAIVSDVAFAAIFVVTLFAYSRVSGVSYASFLPTRNDLESMLASSHAFLSKRLAGER